MFHAGKIIERGSHVQSLQRAGSVSADVASAAPGSNGFVTSSNPCNHQRFLSFYQEEMIMP